MFQANKKTVGRLIDRLRAATDMLHQSVADVAYDMLVETLAELDTAKVSHLDKLWTAHRTILMAHIVKCLREGGFPRDEAKALLCRALDTAYDARPDLEPQKRKLQKEKPCRLVKD